MRVLHVIQELGVGGAERVVLTICEGASDAGHLSAIAAAPGPLGVGSGIPQFPLPLIQRRPWRLVEGTLALHRAVRRWRPDIVHCHNPGMATLAALPTRRGRRSAGLVSVHGVPEEDDRTAAMVLRAAGLPVIACGPGVASALAQQGVRVHATIVNGVSGPPPPANRSALTASWGISKVHRLVVSVGRLETQKNHRLAIEAMVHVPAATLVILGEGRLRDQLEAVVTSLGLGGRVLLPGARADARAVMAAADAVVLPSVWEGLPLVALEALSAGTPLVATAVRGVRELLTDGTDAVLVPPDDVLALAKGLRDVLEDVDLSASLVRGGRLTASKYSESAMVGRFLELYSEMGLRRSP